jgi:hypothetical protein
MVITDLIHQRHYTRKLSLVSPPSTTKQYNVDMEDKMLLSEPTVTKGLINSSKICSKNSRKNLKRL